MERVRVDFKGLMTDLPDEVAPIGALEDAINCRYKDGAIRPVLSKKIDWVHDNTILSYYIHAVDGSTVELIQLDEPYVSNDIYYRKFNGTSWEWVLLLASVNYPVKFSSFNRILVITEPDTGSMWVSKLIPNGNTSTYETPLRWNVHLPVVQFENSSTTTVTKYFGTLEKPKETAKGVYLEVKDSEAKENRVLGVVFLRCALKLYDGSYICHSPIRYVVGKSTNQNTVESFGTAALAYNSAFEAGDDVTSKCVLVLKSSGILYKIPVTIGNNTTDNAAIVASLKTLKDYIVSLDIFVSQQFEYDDIDNIAASLGVAASSNIPILEKKPSEYFEQIDNFYLVKSVPMDDLVCNDVTTYPLYVTTKKVDNSTRDTNYVDYVNQDEDVTYNYGHR